jgi:hypothetical protein
LAWYKPTSGAGQQFAQAGTGLSHHRNHRHTDAGTDAQGLAVHVERLTDGGQHFGGHRLGGLDIASARQQDGELIAAQSRHVIGAVHGRTQTVGKQLQEAVAGQVTELIVDRLEVVQVAIQQGLLVALGMSALAFDALLEAGSIDRTWRL